MSGPITGARNAPPRASAMIEALRGLGYSAATALADIIDNSIAANATMVDLTFVWNGTSSAISILDNGDGMDDVLLDRAMRLGEKGPLEERGKSDLGRFGLGLKTASFSQARRLTVASRKATT
ncbi:ATP-binding protein [Ochrobactrum sp. GPK 3]|uniref:ATP-binding protein n=1 Tax=Brucella sp. 22210 TaxID=3453892 RepID=UPI0031385540